MSKMQLEQKVRLPLSMPQRRQQWEQQQSPLAAGAAPALRSPRPGPRLATRAAPCHEANGVCVIPALHKHPLPGQKHPLISLQPAPFPAQRPRYTTCPAPVRRAEESVAELNKQPGELCFSLACSNFLPCSPKGQTGFFWGMSWMGHFDQGRENLGRK